MDGRGGTRWRVALGAAAASLVLVAGCGGTGTGREGVRADSLAFDGAFLDGVTVAPTPAGDEPQTRYVRVQLVHSRTGFGAAPVEVTADSSGLAGVADMRWPRSCRITGAKAVCTTPRSHEGVRRFAEIDIGVRPLPGVPSGTTGQIVLGLTGPDGRTQTVTTPVRLADIAALALVVAAPPPIAPAPGNGLPDLAPIVVNRGRRAASGVIFTVTTSARLSVARKYSNCQYSPGVADCRLAQTLEPGAAYRFTSSLSLRSAPDAYAEQLALRIAPGDANVTQRPGDPGHGPELRLEKIPTGQRPPAGGGNGDDGLWDASLLFDSAADFAVSAPPVSVRKGGTVQATVSIVNHGPASVEAPYFEDSPAVVDVAVPAGTAVVEPAPPGCLPRDGTRRIYRCSARTGEDIEYPRTNAAFDANTHQDFTFTLRATTSFARTAGRIALLTTGPDRVPMPFDHHPADNTADLVVSGAA